MRMDGISMSHRGSIEKGIDLKKTYAKRGYFSIVETVLGSAFFRDAFLSLFLSSEGIFLSDAIRFSGSRDAFRKRRFRCRIFFPRYERDALFYR